MTEFLMSFIPHNTATWPQEGDWVSHREKWGVWETAGWTERWEGGEGKSFSEIHKAF